MRIVLSRKGFDASNGKFPSPILKSHGNEMFSLPIPETCCHSPAPAYSEITFDGRSLGQAVADLTQGKVQANNKAHLDPDLCRGSVCREDKESWKPLFGQASTAERHLQIQEVGKEDIFLFYGWFRKAQYVDGSYSYIPNAPDLHVIFGWLQIDRWIKSEEWESEAAWAKGHPHCKPEPCACYWKRKNQKTANKKPRNAVDSLYLSNSALKLPGLRRGIPGAGVFKKYDDRLLLTARKTPKGKVNKHRSLWELPGWFHPDQGFTLSYHKNRSRWHRKSGRVWLQTTSPGQEFVINTKDNKKPMAWLQSLFDLV